MHEDQLDVTESTVRSLLDEQFPPWAGLAVRRMQTAATVNAIFRVGDHLAARLPLLVQPPEEALRSLQTEKQAAEQLAAASIVPTPLPLAIGAPGAGYPMPWVIQTWLPGHDATAEDPQASPEFAQDLADFIGHLRAADTGGRRFNGTGRGGHLPDHDEWMEVCFQQSVGTLDVDRLRPMWAAFRALPEVDADVMSHGDLTPPNVLVGAGRLVGVLDGGGYSPADPALDLVGAWHLLDDIRREIVRSALGCSDVQWRRGMAWAFEQAMGLVWYYADSNPAMSRWGRRTLERLSRATPAA